MSLSLPVKEKLNLIRNIGVMLAAGIPLAKVVGSLHDEATGNTKKILKVLLQDVNEGKKISTSLAKFPNAFDPTITSIIESSEESGNLDTTLKDLTNEIEKDIEFNDRVKTALLYPMFVFGLFIVIFMVILVYVIPRISQVFSKLNVVLPLPTKILIWMSETLLAYYPYIIVGIALFIILFITIYRLYKKEVINLLMSLPLLSGLAIQIDITRITNSLAMSLKSGVTLNKALDLAQNIASRKIVAKALQKANKDLEQGKQLSRSLGAFDKIFPSMAIRFMEAGEQSGTLEESLRQLSEQYEDEVLMSLKSVTTLLEPVMLVIVGGFVGGIMLSIIAPIYQLIGNINPR